MSENKNSKEENWSGESSLFEEWNFVVRKTTSGADDAGSDGDSVEILTREKAESVTEIDDEDYCESCDKDSIENKSRKNSVSEENHPENEEGDRSLVNDGSNSNDANSNIVIEEPSDEAENKSSSSEETSVVPVKNETLVERTPVSDEDTPSIENGRLYFTASVVLFIGWIILAFYASTDDSIEKSNLNDDIKWQVMNERYSKLVQELALYKEKSKLIDLSLNDLKTRKFRKLSSSLVLNGVTVLTSVLLWFLLLIAQPLLQPFYLCRQLKSTFTASLIIVVLNNFALYFAFLSLDSFSYF